MDKQQVIQNTISHLKEQFASDASGHDWWHMYRVWQLAKTIAATEPEADMFIVELGALLHDIADWKFTGGDMEAGPRVAREWLTGQHVDEKVIVQIEDIIRNVSFKGAGVASKMKTIEGKIVSDADKLDAIGALGIARTFAYGGSKGRLMYDPERKPTPDMDFEAYKSSNSPTINHFYEKLLLLKDRLFTKEARRLAEKRHVFMEQFLDEFFEEWDGRR